MEQLVEGAGRAAERIGAPLMTATTLVPVPRLFQLGFLIEIAVVAVVSE
jgi:hypothetical protein